MTGKWISRVHVQRGIFFTMKRLGRNLFYQFRPQGFLKMTDDQVSSMYDVCSGVAEPIDSNR